MNNLLAQTPHELGTIGGPKEEGWGPWAQPGGIGQAASYFTTIFSNLIGFLTIIAGLWFMLQFISGALGWITSGGDKAGVQAAQRRITNAFIGLFVVVAAYAIIWIIGQLLGFDILQPQELIKLIGPG